MFSVNFLIILPACVVLVTLVFGSRGTKINMEYKQGICSKMATYTLFIFHVYFVPRDLNCPSVPCYVTGTRKQTSRKAKIRP